MIKSVCTAGAVFLMTVAIGVTGARAQTFNLTGSLSFARTGHQATLLVNGDVLVSGGGNASLVAVPQAERFNPALGTWSTTGSNVTPRLEHAATLLNDGRVLVVGGVGSNSSCSGDASAETYDPVSGTWTLTAPLPATVGSGPVAVTLLDGRVLVAGGGNRCGAVFTDAALFDPAANTWSATTSMAVPREFASAILLPDGRVLVAGGVTSSPFNSVASAEVFDPVANTWTSVGSMATPRGGSCDGYAVSYLTGLPTGSVLAAGALAGTCGQNSPPTATAETFDAGSGSWTSVGSMSSARALTALTTLTDGRVLVAGGWAGGPALSSADVFDPATGLWTVTASLTAPRTNHTATLVSGGKVLVAGGADASGVATATAEIYDPAGVPMLLTSAGPSTVWIGLKNSDDVGTKFDLLAEVLQNGAVVASGQLSSIAGGSSGFNNAILRTINVTLPSSATVHSGDTLSLRLSVRIAVSVTGHRSGTARLWFNDPAATSRLNATINGSQDDYFLVGTSAASYALSKDVPGTGPKSTADVFVDRAVGGNPFKPFGTWSVLLP